MFGSEILDVAIGLIFVYLLLSLICSAANEMIEAWLKNRASDLERGIRELLNDNDGTGLVQKLYEHPLVYSLFKGTYNPADNSNLPSYIPARNFALALMDIVLPAQESGGDGTPTSPLTPDVSSGAAGATSPSALLSPPANNPMPLASLRQAIGDNIQDAQVKKALLTLVDAAGDDVSKARENIEGWFNSGMDRVAGWYKRRSHWIIFCLGLGIAIAINADTIAITNSLSHDKAARESLVAAAQEYAKANPTPTPAASPSPESTASTASTASTSAEAKPDPCMKDANSPECRVKKNLDQIQQLGLPIGWHLNTYPHAPDWTLQYFVAWLLKALGWLLTGLAISLGAPFWFDLLNKFMVIRSTVKPHEKSPEESSRD
jgi:hypothetical protein